MLWKSLRIWKTLYNSPCQHRLIEHSWFRAFWHLVKILRCARTSDTLGTLGEMQRQINNKE